MIAPPYKGGGQMPSFEERTCKQTSALTWCMLYHCTPADFSGNPGKHAIAFPVPTGTENNHVSSTGERKLAERAAKDKAEDEAPPAELLASAIRALRAAAENLGTSG